jgi:hypothetical protein
MHAPLREHYGNLENLVKSGLLNPEEAATLKKVTEPYYPLEIQNWIISFLSSMESRGYFRGKKDFKELKDNNFCVQRTVP